MGVTLIPDAVEKGMTVQANASVRRLLVGNRQVGGVEGAAARSGDRPAHRRDLHGDGEDGGGVRGAINSPALLLRSGLDGNGNVGKRFFLHPVVI